MAPATALDSLIDFARVQRDEALSRLAATLACARESSSRLALLLEYRGEYIARFAADSRKGMAALQLRNYFGFLNKLDAAIRQQQHDVSTENARVDHSREAWRSRESRLQGYAALQARRGAEHALRARRDEQKQTDEHAAQSVLRREHR